MLSKPEEATRRQSMNRFLCPPCFKTTRSRREKRTEIEEPILDANEKKKYPGKHLDPKARENKDGRPKSETKKVYPRTTEEAIAYSLYNKYDKKWLEVRNRCKLYIILWILILVILFIFTFVERGIKIGNGSLLGTESFSFSSEQISLESEVSFSISNDNYLSIETATSPTYNLTAYFLCARSNDPICGTVADYSRGGFIIHRNISGDFDLVVGGRSKAWRTIAVDVNLDKSSSVYLNNTVTQVYKSYRTTCEKMGMYYIRYSGYIDISTLIRSHNFVYLSVEINKTCPLREP